MEIETHPLLMNKVKKIAIPKFVHKLSQKKVYDKISFGIFYYHSGTYLLERKFSLGLFLDKKS